jgi:hypothetical protein
MQCKIKVELVFYVLMITFHRLQLTVVVSVFFTFSATSKNSEVAANMRSSAPHQQNNSVLMVASLDIEHTVRGGNKDNGKLSASAADRKGSSSGSEGSMWPNFAILLTNKEEGGLLDVQGFKTAPQTQEEDEDHQRILSTLSASLP